MRRDMDLARQILLQIEEAGEAHGWVELEIPGRNDDKDEISYHVMLLAQAGLIEAVDVSTLSAFSWRAKRLTWEGHEFLDAARNEGTWSRAKAIAVERGGGLTLDLLKAILLSLLRQQVGV